MQKKVQVDKHELLGVYRQALLKNVSLDELDKKVLDLTKRDLANQSFEHELDQKIRSNFWQRIPKFVQFSAALLPLLLILVGIVLAGSAAWPIIASQINAQGRQQNELLSPLSATQLANNTNLVFAKANLVDENT